MVTGWASPRRSQNAMDPSEAPEATIWACVGCVAREVTPTADASPEVSSEVRDGDSDCRYIENITTELSTSLTWIIHVDSSIESTYI